MNRAILLGALALLVGCSDDERPANMKPIPSEGGRGSGGKSNNAGTANRTGSATSNGGSSGVSSSGGNGGTTGETGGVAANAGVAGNAGASPLMPIVTITSPIEILDPNLDGVLELSTGNDSINVNCSVTPASDAAPVDAASVAIELEQNATRIDTTSSGMAPNFQASFSASEFATGWVTLYCSARALNEKTSVGTDSVRTYVDKGPVITFAAPAEDSAHASSKPLHVAATVVPATTIDPADTRSDIVSVEVKIQGKTVYGPAAPKSPSGVLEFDTSLNDPTVWGTTLPSGAVTLEIIAKNERETSRTEKIDILIDQSPPTIAVTSPVPKQVVRENGKIEFTVSDADSAIDLTSIRVRIQGSDPATAVEYRHNVTDTRWNCLQVALDSKKAYRCSFKYAKVDVQGYLSDVLVEVDASDVAGNDTRTPPNVKTANVNLFIDRIGPFVHLDPPNMRYRRRDTTVDTGHICSDAFDPVGALAVGDGSRVGMAPFFRAFVWDTAQAPPDALIIRPAHTAPDSVYVYLQRNVSVPLLIHRPVDVDGDGNDDNHNCNAINTDPPAPAATPENPNPSKPTPIAIQLAPVTPWGTPTETGSDFDISAPAPVGCAPGTATTVPLARCTSPSDLPYVINHSASKEIAAIYAKNPTNSESLGCTGDTYQFPLNAQYGWVCTAAAANDQAGVTDAKDVVGNLGVSPPLRLCYQSDPYAPITCDAGTMPTCTDGCTVYDPFVAVPPKFVLPMQRIIDQPTN